MIEVWKDIEGYEGLYQVSNLGRVKSLNYNHTNKEKILKLCIDNYGYNHIKLYKNGKSKVWKVHRLVAMAFVDGYFEGAVVNHIDENKQNNIYTNLEWCTIQENTKYSSYKWSGENHPFYGKTFSEEHKQKISESRKGKHHTEESKCKISKTNGKKVRCVETNETFDSLRKAGKSVGVTHSSISSAIKYGTKSGGYHWEYII